MIKKLAAKGSAKGNMIAVFASDTGCCSDGHKQCMYSINLPTLFPITEITVTKLDGADVLFTTAPITTIQALSTFIKDSTETLGYSFSELSGNDTDHPSVAIVNGVLKIKSELVFKSIKIGATTHNFTVKCKKGADCKYNISSVGDGADLTLLWNGTSITIPSYQYGTDTAADVKTKFENALASTTGFLGVEVKDDLINQVFVIDIHAPNYINLILNGKTFSNCGCCPEFVA